MELLLNFLYLIKMLFLIYFFVLISKVLFFFFDKFYIIKALPLVLPVMLAVAFFTLFERKLLASSQRRRGPNVVGFFGLLQAIADGVKYYQKKRLFLFQQIL